MGVSQDYINMLEDSVNESKKTFQSFTNMYIGNGGNNYICMDPVVDHKCLENLMENFNENEKLLLKISRKKNTNEQIRGNFTENLFNSFEINEENFVEKNNKTENFDTFCVKELKNKTQNCKVYFKNSKRFEIQKKNQTEESTLKYLEDNNDNKNFNSEKNSAGIEK